MKQEKKLSAYDKAGVVYEDAEILRHAMQEAGKRTLDNPNKRDVFVEESSIGAHGAIFEYKGPHKRFKLNQVTETLGNQIWIAERVYQETGISYHKEIGINFGQIIAYDVLSGGFLPVIFTDAIPAHSYKWGTDKIRRNAFIEGLVQVCKDCGMALPAGDSSAVKHLVNPTPPVEDAPVLIGSIVGISAPAERVITGQKLKVGNHIIGIPSTGVHMNGHSLIIEEALKLKEGFEHEMSNGQTLGEASLVAAANYTGLIEAWLENKVAINALLAGTGSGLAKLAFDKRRYSYHINNWWEENDIPFIFQYMGELGISLEDRLKTFNMKGGYYAYVPPEEVERAIDIGYEAGFHCIDIGIVEKGERKVVIDPGLFGNKESITLPPPGG